MLYAVHAYGRARDPDSGTHATNQAYLVPVVLNLAPGSRHDARRSCMSQSQVALLCFVVVLVGVVGLWVVVLEGRLAALEGGVVRGGGVSLCPII